MTVLHANRDIKPNRFNGERAKAEMRAARAALRHMIADLPDPEHFADGLPLDVAEALLRARLGKWNGWEAVDTLDAHTLRPWGLCEYGARGITGFGIAVRRALIGQEA